jgi:hypothetical protein
MEQERRTADHRAIGLARLYAQPFRHVQHRQAGCGHGAIQTIYILHPQAAIFQRKDRRLLQLIEGRTAGRIPAPRIAYARNGLASGRS